MNVREREEGKLENKPASGKLHELLHAYLKKESEGITGKTEYGNRTMLR